MSTRGFILTSETRGSGKLGPCRNSYGPGHQDAEIAVVDNYYEAWARARSAREMSAQPKRLGQVPSSFPAGRSSREPATRAKIAESNRGSRSRPRLRRSNQLRSGGPTPPRPVSKADRKGPPKTRRRRCQRHNRTGRENERARAPQITNVPSAEAERSSSCGSAFIRKCAQITQGRREHLLDDIEKTAKASPCSA